MQMDMRAVINMACEIGVFFLDQIDDLRIEFNRIDPLNGVSVRLQNIAAGAGAENQDVSASGFR